VVSASEGRGHQQQPLQSPPFQHCHQQPYMQQSEAPPTSSQGLYAFTRHPPVTPIANHLLHGSQTPQQAVSTGGIAQGTARKRSLPASVEAAARYTARPHF
jgi:hypothetical protein